MAADTTKRYSSDLTREGLLIIANYNQEREIGAYLPRAETYFPKEQTVVVDDGSRDTSPEMAEKAGFSLIRHSVNQGIGAAIRTGIHEARRRGLKWVLISSSNGKIRPEDFETVYRPVAEGRADYTTGSRFIKGGKSPNLTPFRRLSIPVFSFLTSLLLGRRYSDITCGFRAYRLDLLDRSGANLDQEWLSRYELEYYIHYYVSKLAGARIEEVPVTIEYSHLEKGRKSKIRPFTGWWSMIRPFVYLALGLRK
jgi:dolichol-phosphate mannosyltransferase